MIFLFIFVKQVRFATLVGDESHHMAIKIIDIEHVWRQLKLWGKKERGEKEEREERGKKERREKREIEREVRREFEIMERVRGHQNVVQLECFFSFDAKIFGVLEFVFNARTLENIFGFFF